MFYDAIVQYHKTLGNLDAILGKAMAHAEERKFSADNFCTQRIAPDMLPFARNVMIACDTAKAAAGAFSGRAVPKFEDTETTIPELRERIAKTIALLATFSAADFAETTAATIVKIPFPPGKAMLAGEALMTRSIPNFFFHVSMVYAMIRAGGVTIGKMDYLGTLNQFDQ